MGCGADIEANGLLTSLVTGTEFNIPTVDLTGPGFQIPYSANAGIYASLAKLTNNDLTTRTVGGTGTFDALMEAAKAHLREEYDAGRITGVEYTKAYTAMMESAMANATQFLLNREQAYWSAQNSQLQAYTLRAELEIKKLQVAMTYIEANTVKVNYAKTKIDLALADKQYCISKFTLDSMLPKQLEQLTQEVLFTTARTALTNAEVAMAPLKENLLKEQIEEERSKTLDTRTDGITLVKGSVGKQKELYSQQITAYQRDSEVKAGKMFVDAWITQKTIDEGLLAPTGFTNASLDEILTKLKANNGLVP